MDNSAVLTFEGFSAEQQEAMETFWRYVRRGYYSAFLRENPQYRGTNPTELYYRWLDTDILPELGLLGVGTKDPSKIVLDREGVVGRKLLDVFGSNLCRLMCGWHGPYIELKELPEGLTFIKARRQYDEYRDTDGRKFYAQTATVNYSDYRVGRVYVALLDYSYSSPASPTHKETVPPSIQLDRNWSRESVRNDSEYLYIFTDNTDRTSGKRLIPADSWYVRKYGRGKCYPTMTQAVARGLANAFPISTVREFGRIEDARSGRTQWQPEDLEEFQAVIDDEIDTILAAFTTGNYRGIKYAGYLGQGRIARLPKRLQEYLNDQLAHRLGIIQGDLNSRTDG